MKIDINIIGFLNIVLNFFQIKRDTDKLKHTENDQKLLDGSIYLKLNKYETFFLKYYELENLEKYFDFNYLYIASNFSNLH